MTRVESFLHKRDISILLNREEVSIRYFAGLAGEWICEHPDCNQISEGIHLDEYHFCEAHAREVLDTFPHDKVWMRLFS
jgi:hypothetical protein